METLATAEILGTSDAPKRTFLVGDLVEVRMQEKGLRGSWHLAKVVEVLQGKRRVEYEELLDDDEETKLTELIPVGRASDGDNLMGTLPLKSPPKKTRPLLRPRPPVHPDSQPISWQEGVWVDCLFDDAWWEGILAENITTVNVEDVAQITRKSEVDVLFPEENDISKASVNLMRIGQEWDEETGNWSLKGCAPAPVVRPNKKRSKKDSRQSQSNSEKQQQPGIQAAAPLLSKQTEAAMAMNLMDVKTNEASIESELCVNSLAVERAIVRFGEVEEARCNDVAPYGSKGYGYEERLHMFHLGGGSSSASLIVRGPEPVDVGPAMEESALGESERHLNATDDAAPIVQNDAESPVGSNVSSAAQNEEATENFLKSIGWIITKHPHKKTGGVNWKCKSPRITGAAVKTFSSLVEALSFEANKGPPDSNVEEFTILSQTSSADKMVDVNGASANAGIGEDEDENDEYAVSARRILKRSGWDVFNGLRTGINGKSAYVYRTPEAGRQPRKWFKNWRLAIEECVKQEKNSPKQEGSVPNEKKRGGRGQDSPLDSVPNEKKRGGRGQDSPLASIPNEKKRGGRGQDSPLASVPNEKKRGGRGLDSPLACVPDEKNRGGRGQDSPLVSVPNKKKRGGRGQDSPLASVPNEKKRGGREQDSPLPTPRRVTRRLSIPENANSKPEDATISADGSVPSFVESEELPNLVLPEIKLSVRDYSDVDENDKREVNIVFNSGRKRTAVDLGEDFTRSNKNSPISPLMKAYLDKPFGTVSSFTQNDKAYVLHVITHDFLKEQISTTVEKNDMLIKARYVVEELFDNIPVRCNGSLSGRVTLPKNVEREKITAELKSPFLIFTLPKSLTVQEDILEIKIR